MEPNLALRYDFDEGDGFGWLSAELSTPKASGKAGYWVHWDNVETWAAELAAFPMRSFHRCEVEWGRSRRDGRDDQPVIKMVIHAGVTGSLEAIVTLSDHSDGRICCGSVFRTDFPTLQRFAADLASVMRRESEQAVLLGFDPHAGLLG